MLVLALIFASVWIFSFGALPETLIWRFRLTAFAAVCMGLAGLRIALSGPWEHVTIPHSGSPKVQGSAVLAEIAQSLGPVGTGLVLLAVAGWMASGAHAYLSLIDRGYKKMPPT